MSLFKFLQGIGDRLGILETVPNPSATPPVEIQTRTVTLQELTVEIKSNEIRDLADSPSELTVPFDKIYESAGIPSDPKGWTIDRLKQLVAAEPFNNKPPEEARKSVLDRLNAEGVSVESILKDAIARDRALDAFEAIVRERMKKQREACKRKLLEIESRIGSLMDEKNRLNEKLKADDEKWSEWKKRKRDRERELALAASYIVDHTVVTEIDEEAGLH